MTPHASLEKRSGTATLPRTAGEAPPEAKSRANTCIHGACEWVHQHLEPVAQPAALLLAPGRHTSSTELVLNDMSMAPLCVPAASRAWCPTGHHPTHAERSMNASGIVEAEKREEQFQLVEVIWCCILSLLSQSASRCCCALFLKERWVERRRGERGDQQQKPAKRYSRSKLASFKLGSGDITSI